MSKPVIKAIIDQNFNQVLNLFEQHEVRHLPVLDVDTDTDEEFLVGLIPNRDVLRQLFPGYGTLVEKGIEQISVRLPCSDVFCRNIETTAPSGLLFPTIEKMSQMKSASCG